MFGDPGREIRETAKDVSIARDQLAIAALQASQCAKTIDFQFKHIAQPTETLTLRAGKSSSNNFLVQEERNWLICFQN
jgi:hypothetical protein